MHLCSFGHSLLSPVTSSTASPRRVLRAILGAAKRFGGRPFVRGPLRLSHGVCCCGKLWELRLEWIGLSFGWKEPEGCCAVLVELYQKWTC